MDQRTRISITAIFLAAAVLFPGVSRGAPPWKREVPANADGRRAYEKGDYDAAQNQFERAGDEVEGDASRRAAFNRGAALFKAGKMKEAEEAFGQAAASDDDELRADALFNRGMVHEKQQDWKGAIQSYRNSLLTNPKHERSRINLEQLLRRPPPPPQPQDGDGKKEEGDPKQESQQAKAEPDPKEDPKKDAQPPEGKEQDAAQKPDEQGQSKPESGKLTEKEADDILSASEREKAGSRFLQTDKPPPDYDPSRNW